ncbi:hypothetical protein WJX81_006978 [Elliptochloris bilobata]|uniref:Maintenance of Photosystem II under High light 2 C-terminal domain-containing protein n=1 Tax=Elliptochloris bilobata TaxID=381761 RepID=A0AAW1REF2_9CHLO
MVRRRIAGAAGEDDEGSGGMVRVVSLPKHRRSGQGATLKAALTLLTVLLVWLTGLKILDQPRFSHTRGHAYAVRTLDTLYDVSTGLPYAAADAARYLAARTSAGLADASAHPAAAQFASTLTSVKRRLLSIVGDVNADAPIDGPDANDEESEELAACGPEGHNIDCRERPAAGMDPEPDPNPNPSLLSTWRRRLAGLIGGSKFGPLGGGENAGQVTGNGNTILSPSGTVYTQASGIAASSTLDSGVVATTPLGFGVGARVGSLPGGMNVPTANATTGTTPYAAKGTVLPASVGAASVQGFVSPVVANAIGAGAVSGGMGSTGAAAGTATSAASGTSTSAQVNQGAPNERPALLAPVTPGPVVTGWGAGSVQPQSASAGAGANPGPFSQVAMLALLPALLTSPAARALIPDDDDEELIEKAKANRKARLASEKEVETEFKKSGGFAEGEVVVVQRAVNRLARSGEALAAGDLSTVAATVTGAWVSELEKVAAGLSTSDAARESVGAVLQGINRLGENAKSGALEDAKRSFVTSVSALQSWAETAGIAGELKGL